MIRRKGFAEHLGLFEYRENAVRLAVTVVVAAAAAVVVEPLAAAVVLLVAAPEAAAAAAVAAVAAVGTGWSSVPCGTAPIQDSDSKELRLPCQQR